MTHSKWREFKLTLASWLVVLEGKALRWLVKSHTPSGQGV